MNRTNLICKVNNDSRTTTAKKGKEKNCILVQDGNGKDEMSFPSVGRNGKENIEIL